MGSGGKGHKFWCDKCQCYDDFSDFETCESVCGYCEARENKARVKTAEAEVERLRAELATMPRPEDRCHGEWPCEASTALASAEAEVARAEARAEAAEAEVARLHAALEQARAELTQTRADRDLLAGLWLATVPMDVLPGLLPADRDSRNLLAAVLAEVDLHPNGAAHTDAGRAVIERIVADAGGAR